MHRIGACTVAEREDKPFFSALTVHKTLSVVHLSHKERQKTHQTYFSKKRPQNTVVPDKRRGRIWGRPFRHRGASAQIYSQGVCCERLPELVSQLLHWVKLWTQTGPPQICPSVADLL